MSSIEHTVHFSTVSFMEDTNSLLGDIMSENNNSNIGWFIAGLGLGVAGAILYAPKSGVVTRKVIMNRMVNGREYLSDLAMDAGEEVAKLVDRGKSVIDRQKEKMTTAMDAGRQAVHEATRKS